MGSCINPWAQAFSFGSAGNSIIYTNQLNTFREDQSALGYLVPQWLGISLALGRVDSSPDGMLKVQLLPTGRTLLRKDLLSDLSKVPIFRLICIVSNCFLHSSAVQVLCTGDTWWILPWYRQKSVQEGRIECVLHREVSKGTWKSLVSNPFKMTSKKTASKIWLFFLTKLFN